MDERLTAVSREDLHLDELEWRLVEVRKLRGQLWLAQLLVILLLVILCTR